MSKLNNFSINNDILMCKLLRFLQFTLNFQFALVRRDQQQVYNREYSEQGFAGLNTFNNNRILEDWKCYFKTACLMYIYVYNFNIYTTCMGMSSHFPFKIIYATKIRLSNLWVETLHWKYSKNIKIYCTEP